MSMHDLTILLSGILISVVGISFGFTLYGQLKYNHRFF